jgi:hypothetical protein
MEENKTQGTELDAQTDGNRYETDNQTQRNSSMKNRHRETDLRPSEEGNRSGIKKDLRQLDAGKTNKHKNSHGGKF